jgi:mycofactocin precursor
MEAGMRKQALSETAPAQPMLNADESARELLAPEVAIGGICGVY